MADADITLAPARREDVPVIVALIRGLADYERLSHEMVATEAQIEATLFGASPAAEVSIAWAGDEAVAFALFFHNYSTFLGRRGLYLEDLFVIPEWRGRGIGRRLLQHLARLAVERGCGRFEWSVLSWNEPAVGFYQKLGAEVMEDWRICRVTGDALLRLAE